MNLRQYVLPISIIFSLIIGVYIGVYIQGKKVKQFISTFKNMRDGDEKFSFINPLIGTVSSPATDIGIYSDIKDRVSSYLEEEKEEGNIYKYSFYFKDLNSPLWFGINEDDGFFPASLFKLPIAIAVYKQGEKDKDFLKKKIIYTEEIAKINTNILANENSSLVVGNEYTVEDLVRIMLELSDNGAKDLLVSVVNKKYLDDVMAITSLLNPELSTDYQISSRQYTLFLRILYNASYLYKSHSEYLLGLLAKSAFKDGLVAGVPSGIIIAHKFGTHQATLTLEGVSKEVTMLHDCGIVYHGDNPYALCFMTEGKNPPSLLTIISHVSSLVYEEQESGNH